MLIVFSFLIINKTIQQLKCLKVIILYCHVLIFYLVRYKATVILSLADIKNILVFLNMFALHFNKINSFLIPYIHPTGCFKQVVLPKTFWNIFTLFNSFCMKFCKFVRNSYPHISTNFCRFILQRQTAHADTSQARTW